MVVLLFIVIKGKVLEKIPNSLLKVFSLSFQFSHLGIACAVVTATMETRPLHRQKAAKHTDMVTKYDYNYNKCLTAVGILLRDVSPPYAPLAKWVKLQKRIITSGYMHFQIKLNLAKPLAIVFVT